MKSTMQPTPLLISRLLTYGTSVFPDAEVVTWTQDAPRRSSYREVGEDCGRLANALRRLGIDGDQRVGTFMWNNEEHLELYLAVPSMGAVLHPINIRLFPPQIAYVINHAANTIVVVDASLAEAFARVLEHCPGVRHVVVNGATTDAVRNALRGPARREVHDYRALLAAENASFEWPEMDENLGAAMCYTSGTTGDPKGVVYSHRSNYLHAMQVAQPSAFDVRAGDRLLAIVPMFHANAWGLPYVAMLAGASLVQPDRFLDGATLARMIEAERVTGGGGVPTVWTAVIRFLQDNPEIDTSSVRRFIVGGSACPAALLDAFDRQGLPLVHAWGMTEMSPLGSIAVPPPEATGEARLRYRLSQGRLPAPVEGRLVGPDGSVLAWDGASVGELEVRGPWIASGYYTPPTREGDADASSKFNEGWLRTGDVGTLTSDGYLTLTDRAKDVIKSGGEWISSVELENHLMAHTSVREAAVVGVPDERWGERPLAVVVSDGERASPQALAAFLEGRVARWQIPERWVFLEQMPLTSVGKFDKKQLRAAHARDELSVEVLV